MKNITKYLLAILLALGMVGPVTFAQAATNDQGLQISPLTLRYEIKKGENTAGKVTIKNLSSEEINYAMEAEDFDKVDDQGAPSFLAEKKASGVSTLADWIKFDQDKEGSLKSKQEKIINFTVNVSADADPGGHYAGVFVRKVESATAGQVGVAGRVGTLVLVTVPGQITKKAEIKDFEVPESTFKIQPVDLSARVYNSGNTFYEAKAEIESSSIWGTDKIDLGSHVIPHQNSRSYSASWSPKIPFGLYKLTLRVTDGDGTVHEKNASAWILPYEIVVPFIIIIILIILAIVFALRRKPKDQIGPTPQQV